jgi:CBS domain-containing protein
MRCEEIMKRQIQTSGEDETVQRAAEKMASANIGFLPICDGGGKVLGILTDRDITVRAVAKSMPGDTRVGQVMTRAVVSCRPTDDLSVAEQRMIQHRVSRIVVEDDRGILNGIISLSDIAEREPGRRAAIVLREVAAREAPRSQRS